MSKKVRVRTFGELAKAVVDRVRDQFSKSGHVIPDIVHEDSEYRIRFVFPSGRYQVECKETSCHFTFMVDIGGFPLLTNSVIPLQGDTSELNVMRAKDAFVSYRNIQIKKEKAQNLRSGRN